MFAVTENDGEECRVLAVMVQQHYCLAERVMTLEMANSISINNAHYLGL